MNKKSSCIANYTRYYIKEKGKAKYQHGNEGKHDNNIRGNIREN
jgi:hypothetical protein